MTWVAADASGTPIEGFEYGTPVEWDENGKTVTGTIVVQGTDQIGDVHKIQRDDDPRGEMAKISPTFVRPRQI